MSRGLHIQPQKESSLLTTILWLVALAFIVLCGWFGYRYYALGEQPPVPIPMAAVAQPDVIEEQVPDDEKSQHLVSASYPRFLSIESLAIDRSRIFPVGVVEQTGELDTPPNIHDTGWFEESALPGDGLGAMLMDGHNGGPTQDGVFKQLPDLQIGAEIVIERGDGQKFTYRTESVEVVSLEELNDGGMNELANSINADAQGLNIISCTGNWVPAMQTYDKRVVVRAALVPEIPQTPTAVQESMQ